MDSPSIFSMDHLHSSFGRDEVLVEKIDAEEDSSLKGQEIIPANEPTVANNKHNSVVSNEEADAILYSDIVSFQTIPISIQKDLVSAYRIVMKVDFKLEDRKKEKIVWEEREIESGIKSDYRVTNDIGATRTAKDAAIKKNCKDLSQDVISRVFEGF